MDEITYRLAGPADGESLVRLRMAMQAEVGFGASSIESRLEGELRDYFNRTLPTGEFVAYLAERKGQIIASSGMVWHAHPPSRSNLGGREAYIMNMYTLPEFRRRGIATTLLRLLLDHARRAACPRVVLYALPLGEQMYLKEGFVRSPHGMRLDLAHPIDWKKNPS